jgi:glyoxylase-like metal-dependent hydrolase (beta-lactamase superfamily II)
VVAPTDELTITRESYGPFTRFVMSAPVNVPGDGWIANAEVSAYLVDDLLIDAGGSRFGPALVEALLPAPPRRILLTHQHEDHVGAVGALRRAFGRLEVFAPATLLPLLKRGDPIGGYRAAYWGQPEAIGDVTAVEEGDVFDAGGLRLNAVATPGHTPGHMSFIADVDGTMFGVTGDLLVSTRSYLGFFESSVPDQIRSLRRVAAIASNLYVLPAHGRARPAGAAVLSEAADWLEAESETIRAAAARLGAEDPIAVARFLYGAPESAELATGGEFSTAALVRSVLAPPRSHPVTRIDFGPAPAAVR